MKIAAALPWLLCAIGPRPARGEEARTVKRIHVGAEVGAEIQRAELGAGLLVRARADVAITADDDRLRFELLLDWVRTTSRDMTLVSPAAFPRSNADLLVQTQLVTLGAGASVRLATVSGVELRGALTAGPQLTRDRFDAYGMTQRVTDTGLAGTVEVYAAGRAPPVFWRASLGWREAVRDLGSAESYGEETTSGAVLAAGIAW